MPSQSKLILGAAVAGTVGALVYLNWVLQRRKGRVNKQDLPPICPRIQCPYVAATVTELFVHPVKSLKGYAVETAELTPTGIRYDREWIVVRRKDSKIMTIRELPCMVLLQATIAHGVSKRGVALRFEPVPSHPLNAGRPAFVLDTVDHTDVTDSSQAPSLHDTTLSPSNFTEVDLWGMKGVVRHESRDVAKYISDFIQHHVSSNKKDDDDDEKVAGFDTMDSPIYNALLKKEGGSDEEMEPPYFLGRIATMRNPLENPKYRAGIPDPNQRVAMQDFTALQIISQDSLRDLERRVQEEEGNASADPLYNVIQAERFRPNVVVSGNPAFDEDHWDEMEIMGPRHSAAETLQLKVTKMTTRCAIPTVFMDGTRHPKFQPTKYLRERHSAVHIPVRDLVGGAATVAPFVEAASSASYQPIFGLNVSVKNNKIVVDGGSCNNTISVGDAIIVTRRINREPCFAKKKKHT